MGIFFNVLRKLYTLKNPIVRDFTEKAEEDMKAIAKDVHESDWDLLSKLIKDPFGRWLDKQGYLWLIGDVDDYQKRVIDVYNYGADAIHEICEQMRDYDTNYGQIVANYANQADNVHRLTLALAECLDVDSSDYTSDHPISDRLQWFKSHWVEDINGEEVQISDLDSNAQNLYHNELDRINISEHEILEFCFNEDSIAIFEDYTDYIFNNAMDWSFLDGYVVYKGVEYTIDEWLSILTGGNFENFQEKAVREELNKLISSVISAEKVHQTFIKDHDAAKECVETLIKDYLDDKNKKSEFKTFVKNMGGITFVKQLAKTCPELLDYLFTDYEKGLKILEDIEKTCDCSGNAEMKKAIAHLKVDYNNKWMGVLRKATIDFSTDMLSELSEKGIKEWIEDEIGDTSVLLSVLDIYDLEEKTDGALTLFTLRKIVYDLQKGYEKAIEKIKSGDYTKDDLEYAKNMFKMLKEATKSVYETYRDMYTDNPSTQIWCNKQIQKIEAIQMNGYNDSYLFKK